MGKDPDSANLQCRISRDLEGLSARKKYICAQNHLDDIL